MIRHIVLFNLKSDLEDADREWLFGQIRTLAKIPSAKRFAFGKKLEPREDWYKARIAPDYTWSLTMEFDNEDGLYAYQKDQTHLTVAQEIRKRITDIKIFDFSAV